MQTLSEALAEDTEPIHLLFGLSYANYLVMPRSALQSMPTEWQRQFAPLVAEYRDTLSRHDIEEPEYNVQCGQWTDLSEMDEDLAKTFGYTCENDGWDVDADEWDIDAELWHSPDGREIWHHDKYFEKIFIDKDNHLPHYNRGRTKLWANEGETE